MGFFTKIFGIESICYSPDQSMFAEETFRLLKPGGQFVRADGFLISDNLSQYEKNILNKCCEGWAVPGLQTLKKYENILKSKGFVNIKSYEVTDKIMKSSKRT